MLSCFPDEPEQKRIASPAQRPARSVSCSLQERPFFPRQRRALVPGIPVHQALCHVGAEIGLRRRGRLFYSLTQLQQHVMRPLNNSIHSLSEALWGTAVPASAVP